MSSGDCGTNSISSRFAVDATSGTALFTNFTSADSAFPLDGGSTLAKKQAHLNYSGLNGETAERAAQSVKGIVDVSGDLPTFMTPDSLQFFAPYVTGRDWDTGETWPTTSIPDYFHILMHRGAELDVFDKIWINTATFTGETSDACKMSFGLIGSDRLAPIEAVQSDVDQWPSNLNISPELPYMFDDISWDIDSTDYSADFRSFEIQYNNQLAASRFQGPTICGVQRSAKTTCTVTLQAKFTYANAVALMRTASAQGGLDVTMTFDHTDSDFEASFRFQKLQIDEQDPPITGGEILLTLTGQARMGAIADDNGGAEFIIANDNVSS